MTQNIKIENNMSSSCLTRRSRNKDLCADWIPDQVGDDRRVESGRSMVEMLGTLAIIGVLSVGSIAGYRYAMDNYYTNEILAGASQRAVLVAAQIISGNAPSLAEFDKIETAGAVFSGEVADDIENAFGIKVSGVKGSVCENLVKATAETDVYIANDDATLSEETCQDDNNEFLFVYSNDMGDTPDTACLDVTCDDGLTCFHGECKCSNGLFVCGTQCCAEGTYCAQGGDTSTYTCAVPTGDCTKNSDCKDAEGNVDTSKYCKFSDGSCTNPGTGTCTDKGILAEYTLNLPSGDLTVYKGSGTMSWWSASNLCQAHGKQMVTMADLGIADSGTNTYCYFDKTNGNYATKPCICNGGSDSDCSATNAAIRTNTGALGTTAVHLWLADNSKSSSCYARPVNLGNGYVGNGIRYDLRYAFCR